MKTLRSALLASVLGLSMGLVSAASVTQTFGVTIDTVGSPLLGQSFYGSFSYDDATPDAAGFGSEQLFDLDSFSFLFAGVSYGLGDLFTAYAVHDGGAFTGLEVEGLGFIFLPQAASDGFFAYDDGDTSGLGAVRLTGRLPEPASAALLLLALAGLATRRRRA